MQALALDSRSFAVHCVVFSVLLLRLFGPGSGRLYWRTTSPYGYLLFSVHCTHFIGMSFHKSVKETNIFLLPYRHFNINFIPDLTLKQNCATIFYEQPFKLN